MIKTVALDAQEWKDLVANNAARFHGFITSIAIPDPKSLQSINAHLDRMKALVLAWHLSQQPSPAVEQSQVTTGVVHVTEDQLKKTQVTPTPATQSDIPGEKRKAGWPKGKKRTRNGAAQVGV